jgi:hypothetical protein
MFIDPNVIPFPQVNLNTLIIFQPNDIVLTNQEAFDVLAFFFFHPGILPADLTENDLAFAQALLTEAIDSSYGISFRTSNQEEYMSKRITKIAINFLIRTNGNFNFATANKPLIQRLMNKGGIHYLVRKAMYANFHFRWVTRVRAGVPAIN